MGDVNEDSNSSSWPHFYGEKTLTNGQHYNGFIPRTITDAKPACDKDLLKQKMLEHEVIFNNQVYELHRLYRRQLDMMEEVKRNEYQKQRISIDTSSSSSLLPSQKPYEDGQKRQTPSFPLFNSCSRQSVFGTDISRSPLSCSKANVNNNSSKDCEIMEGRPSKLRKKLFDLELPPDENIDYEHEEIQCKQASEESSYKDYSSRRCFRESGGLADLNEPLNVEEPMANESIDRRGPSSRPKGSLFPGPTHDLLQKSQNGAFDPLFLEGGNGRSWLSNTCETGNSRSNMNFTPGTYPEISTRVQDDSRFTPIPFPTLCTSSSSPYMNHTDLGTSRGKSNGSLTHKLTSFQRQPSFLSSQHSHVVFGDKWPMNGCYTPNGYFHGSSSVSKDPCARLPFGGFDHPNYNNVEDRSQKIHKGSNFIDLTDTTKGIDLNNVRNSSRKCDQTVLPWLQAKPNVSKNDARDDRVEKGVGFPVFGNSCVSRNESSSLVSTSASLRDHRENGKIKAEMENRGFDMNIAWEDHANMQTDVGDCDLGEKTDGENDKIKNHFDLNSCLTEDDDVILPEFVKRSSEEVKKIRMEIDLEAPAVPEDEETAIDEVKKIDHCDDEFLAKVAAEALVALTGISSQHDQAVSQSEVAPRSNDNDRLIWFVKAIENAGFDSNERDEYEELTLQQELTKEEDYMPKPLAPDIQEPEEAGPPTGPSRPRRGQARRGRPRRDFQRDVLPGLVSLSRHEVTEDLQTFGGLMKATGHSWNAGLTRRNGTRGRPKSVVVALEPPPPPPAVTPPPPPPPPLPLTEVVGLEERSLTGWGKTPRRPRRQRRAAGTSVVVPLT